MKNAVLTSFTILCLFSTAFLTGITLNIQTVKAGGTIYIRATGEVEGTDEIERDGDNYTFTDSIRDMIVVERSNITIDGNGYTLGSEYSDTYGVGFDLTYMTNVTVKNVTIRRFTCGVHAPHASNIIITENKVFGCGSGIRLWGPLSSNNTVSENHMEDNGISISGSSNNTISGNYLRGAGIGVDGDYNNICGNTIEGPTSVGIMISSSSHNSLCGNTISTGSMGHGIEIAGGSDCIVSGNIITDSGWGIGLHSSSNNSIFGNTILNNEYGISVKHASNNSIHYNNFLNNEVQESAIALPYLKNNWDAGYPSGGNFWSDYTGEDADGDGIGDTIRVIDENNTDNYPLMGMFADFKATSEHHVQTICNSTISDFQFNGTAISFNVTGEDETIGLCRICIPTAVMNDTYTVLVNGMEVPHTLLPFSNSTYSYLYFTYTHSTQDVVIIPEFPSVFIVPLLMALTLGVAVLLTKKRLYIKDS